MFQNQLLKQLLQKKNELFSENKNRNFKFTFNQKEELVEQHFQKLIHQQKIEIDFEHYLSEVSQLYHKCKLTKAYALLKKMPKGATHHLHIDCCNPPQFVTQYLANSDSIYLSKQKDGLRYGTPKQAQQNSWISLKQLSKQFQLKQFFNQYILERTIIPKSIINDQIRNIGEFINFRWKHFEFSINSLMPIFYSQEHLGQFLKYTFENFYAHGVQRFEARICIFPIKGKSGEMLDQSHTMRILSQQIQKAEKKLPGFSVGIIAQGLKSFSKEQLFEYMDKVNKFKKEYKFIVGFDMVQNEQNYKPLHIVASYLKQYIQKNQFDVITFKQIPFVLHAGQTRNLNNNIQIALSLNTKRLGHALNLTYVLLFNQHPQLFEYLKQKQICIQSNPVSNQGLGYIADLKQHPMITFFKAGIPVSVSSDDPGRLGYQGVTFDFYIIMMAMSFKLRDIKLLILYSIQYSLINPSQKEQMLKQFQLRWFQWINTIQ